MSIQWEEIPIKRLFLDRKGGAWGEDPDPENGIVCIRAADFITEKIRHATSELTRRKFSDKEVDTRSLKSGDLIIEKSGGGELQPVGRVVSFELNETALCSNFLELLRPNQKITYPRFAAYLLNSLWLQRVNFPFIKQTTGIQNLDIEEYFSQKVNIPPLATQQAIADYLDRETDQIDILIASKERLLKLLAEKRLAVITHAVTRGLNVDVSLRDSGVEWLGMIPSNWEVKKLKYLIFGIETGFTPQSYNFPAQNGEWGVLKTGCVNGGVFNSQENKALPNDIEIPTNLEVVSGDVLMSRASGSLELIGSVALVNNKPNARLLLSDKTFRIKINHEVCDSHFFVNVMGAPLMRDQIRRVISGAEGLANNIAQTDIREFWLPVPPISEQKEIVEHVKKKTEKIDRLSELAKSTIEHLHERRTSLISAVVSGQLKVN